LYDANNAPLSNRRQQNFFALKPFERLADCSPTPATGCIQKNFFRRYLANDLSDSIAPERQHSAAVEDRDQNRVEIKPTHIRH
jgi:hypothetical protein